MPGDLRRRVPQEISIGQGLPDALGRFRRDACGGEALARECLGPGNELFAIQRRLVPAAERGLDAFVQLVEQRRLPGIPELRVGASHVGHGEHVQVVEPDLVADVAGEGVDHLRVGDVLLLCGHREFQVIEYQPGDQAGVVAGEPLLEAEGLRVHGAELRVVAAAALGDVVEDRREVGEFRLGQRAEDLRELREFLVVALEREAPEVAHDEQRVRIHRVGVEQVVLHAADDAPEGGDVAAEHAVQVHAPELVGDSGRGPQDLEEQAVVARVLAELLVDEPEIVVDQADGARAHALQPRVLLQHDEQFEQRGRVAREGVVRDGLQVLVPLAEVRRERQRRRVARGQDVLAELLQQQLVQPAHQHGGPVIALHELLDGERVGRVLVAEHACQSDLVIEKEPVLAPPADEMQREAHPPQPGLGRLELRELTRGDEAVRGEFLERLRPEMPLRDPGDRLDVAQASRALLHIGLEVVGGVVEPVVAFGLFGELGFEEIARRPEPVGRECAAHGLEEGRRARQQARLEQRRGDRKVRKRFLPALVDRAYAVSGLEADVPQEGQEALERSCPGRLFAFRQEHHDVDVRTGQELAAPVAADGDQGDCIRRTGCVQPPGARDEIVDQPRTFAYQHFHGFVRPEAAGEFLVALDEGGAEIGDRDHGNNGTLTFYDMRDVHPGLKVNVACHKR